MPELPEVETMVRGIRPHVEGRTLASFRRTRCTLKPIHVVPRPKQINRRISGQKFSFVERFAKRIVLRLSEGGTFVIEPRMTGLMLLSDPPSHAHLRAEWCFVTTPGEDARYPSLWFWDRRGLGTISYYEPAEFERRVCQRLGPDALKMDVENWKVALGRTSRPVKVALIDQALVAGIGNLYASEILYLSNIHPARTASSLSKAEIARLSDSVRTVLEEAILHEGSTLSDGTYRNALAQNGRYQNAHRVYARAGKECPACGHPIERIVQSQRSTFFCGRCQR